ncbi:MAG: methyltransferase domain-containing protein [Candidatus Acidiferrales bacterium]
MATLLNDALLRFLACPLDHTPLRVENDSLVCENGHRFAIESGVPVFTNAPRREPVPLNMGPCLRAEGGANRDASVDPFVNDWIVNTNGNLYRRARGRLPRYPIPKWPFGEGGGKVLIDIGCSWGRWSIAAARAGYRPIGVDVHIDALVAATRVSRQLETSADFVCSDAERLPLQSRSVDCVFSYSVLQHLDRAKVLLILGEIARVLKPRGLCVIQLPNAFGALSILQQLKRGFRDARTGTFEMRYWPRNSIQQGLQAAGLQNVTIHADGFFSQNPQLSDLDLLSPAGKLIVLASYAGRKAADAVPILAHVADSLWIEAHAPSELRSD